MNQYKQTIKEIMTQGIHAPNRTGVDTTFALGKYVVFDLAAGFPLLTLRKMAWKSIFAEMMGFVRGYDNATDFRNLGTSVWNANANENEAWLNNPYRKGPDDLGRIYGVQARDWQSDCREPVDQLRNVYDKLSRGEDDRRLIVTHWNPGELNQMALPPCHLMYQFGRRYNKLDLFVYIRSNDVGLGMPFNIAGYAWLLSVMAHITRHHVGTLHYFAFNYHIYDTHKSAMRELLSRETREMPELWVKPTLASFEDLLETDMDAFQICGYNPHPAIKLPMAV